MDSFPEAPQRTQLRLSGTVVLGVVGLLVLLALASLVDFTTELLWFDSLRMSGVFLTGLYAKAGLFALGAALFLLIFAVNVAVARRLAYRFDPHPRRPTMGGTWEDLLVQIGAQMARRGDYTRLINWAVLGGGLLLALFMGLLAAGHWFTMLQLVHQTSFEVADPVAAPGFGRDVGFYLFVMPALRAIEGWLFMALVLVALSVLAVYAIVLTYELTVNLGEAVLRLTRGIKAHLLCLAALGFVLLAGNHILDMFELVRSTRGAAYGAAYTDVHGQIPVQYLTAAAALAAAALCIVSIAGPGFRPALIGGAVWAATLFLAGWLFPFVMQEVDVKPNELDREREYIASTIEYTRRAFGLDGIEEQDIAFEDAVSPSVLSAEQATLNNVRLWDHRPLLDTYNQIQAIRQYYQFGDVDIDRYTIGGEYRQVMVAAREILPERLPAAAQTWVSRQLQYTHGYGVAMSRVNVISGEGLPELTIRDVPPVSPFPLTRPEIYFGEHTDHYVITRTTTREFDYPRGDSGEFTTYQANAGVRVGTLWERFLFALKFQDPNFVLNTSFQPDSQLLYRRDVAERARQIAPFLRLDPDPYMVVADGGLHWIQDAYTTADRYPYSQSYQPPAGERGQRRRSINYIRNSVKIVTNAYDGTVRFYVVDPSDPLVQAYQRIYPDLFSPQSEAPAAIREHFRYPEELFRIQSDVYRLYHTRDPVVFYLREDVWAIPNELFYDKRQEVEPYYVIMKLPREPRPEFILMLPFVPSTRDNMIGWLAARSDPPNYGKMLVYKYPKDKLVFGPFQLETRIDQDPTISSQFSLWNQAGSRVFRGNLLVIPIGQSNLYVEPIYLQATASPLPELKRVIVATGNRIVMEPTLEEGLAKLFAGEGFAQPPALVPQPGVAPAPPPGAPAALSTTAAQLAREAQEQYRRAQEALRAGDFARYGEEVRRLEELINRLVEATR